jgi:hypothetical protein
MGYSDILLDSCSRISPMNSYQDHARQLLVDSTILVLEMQKTVPQELAKHISDLMKQSAKQIIANEQTILDYEAQIPTQLSQPIPETRITAFLPSYQSTCHPGLIELKVLEKKA